MYARGRLRRRSAAPPAGPIVTAGLRWPPEMAIVAVIMTARTIAWAVAMPKTP